MTISRRYARASFVKPAFASGFASGPLEDAVLTELAPTVWHDFADERVINGTNIEVKSKLLGGGSLVELASYSGLVIGADRLPPGGQMVKHATFNNATVMQQLTNWPTAANAVVSFLIIVRGDEINEAGRDEVIWGGPQGAGGNKFIRVNPYQIYNQLGTGGTLAQSGSRFSHGFWHFIIGSHDHNTGTSKVLIDNSDASTLVPSHTVAGAQNVAANNYLGGLNTGTLSFRGRIGPFLRMDGTTGAADLLDPANAAKLKLAVAYAENQIGRFRQ